MITEGPITEELFLNSEVGCCFYGDLTVAESSLDLIANSYLDAPLDFLKAFSVNCFYFPGYSFGCRPNSSWLIWLFELGPLLFRGFFSFFSAVSLGKIAAVS